VLTPVIAAPVHVAETAPPPAPPVGPFFETKDVNESPRIAARVEPRVPEALRARSMNDIVIVRALVSQSGRPSRVSLLRRSKAGPELDTIVVEAVNQWTFAPARKKGEAVSCWFNFAIPVSGAD
jgi:TonB family protein